MLISDINLLITMLIIDNQQHLLQDLIELVNVAEVLEQADSLTRSSCHFIFDIKHRFFHKDKNLVFVVKDIKQLRIDIHVPCMQMSYTAQLVETEVLHCKAIEHQNIS